MVTNSKNLKNAVERHEFSTLSTDLSTGVVHSKQKQGICILVDISYFDQLRQTSHFFLQQNVDDGKKRGRKKGLDKEKSVENGLENKKIKKGIDFIEKPRYN